MIFGGTEGPCPPKALVVVQHLNPKPQHQPCGVEMFSSRGHSGPCGNAVSTPNRFGSHLSHREDKILQLNTFSVFINKNHLALGFLLTITVTTPHHGGGLGKRSLGRFVFQSPGLSGLGWKIKWLWLKEILYVPFPFLFLGVHKRGAFSLTAFPVTKTHPGGRC